MSFRTPVDCSTDQLDRLEKQFADDLGQAFNNIINEIAQVEPEIESLNIGADIAQGNEVLQNLLNLGDGTGVTQLSDVPALFGIDSPASQVYDEELIFKSTGLVMTSGILYKSADAGTSSEDNIEVLRRVYNAVGRSIDSAAVILASPLDQGYRSEMQIRKYPPASPNKALTLEQLRTQTGITQLQAPDYVTLSDKSTVVIYRKPLAIPDITSKELVTRFGLNIDDMTSCIVQKGTAKNNTNAINNWIQQGYNAELPYILDGVDPISESTLLVDSFNDFKSQVNNLIKDLQFIQTRLGTVDPSYRSKYISAAEGVERSIKRMIGLSLFQVVIVRQSDIVTRLRENLSDAEITHLLENQVYVKGINFEATEIELAQMLSDSSSISAGDSTISGSVLNSPLTVAQTNYGTLLLSLSDISSVISQIGTFTSISITDAINTLSNMASRNIVTAVTEGSPVAGFPCMVTPNTAVMSRLNFDRSFKVNLKLGKLDDAINKLKELYEKIVADSLTKILKTLVNAIKKALQMVNQVRDKLLLKIVPLKRQLEEFIAKYLTFIGKGDFDSSLLKCAVNFNLGLGTGILDLLETLIENLVKKINQLIGLLTKILLDTVTNLICPILAWIEKLLGAGNSYLPSFCSINSPILLPAEAIAALAELRMIANLQGQTFSTYSANLIQARALVTTAPDRLAQFRTAADCANTSANLMMQKTLISVVNKVTIPPGTIPV